ncbi:MAG: GIY-YIG nuclease family protein [Gammaproteobacteria bacterium]|nr:GIY-YIG nuclease family protein [Gammaproteobacteria bacterium]
MTASSEQQRRQWHVYIVLCADGTLYTGVTNDVETRVAAHNAGRGAKYTRPRLPVSLVYTEAAGARGDALRRELEIKRLPRALKSRLAAGAADCAET